MGLTVLPGMFCFGLVVGATGAQVGLTFFENLAMNVFVYSGIAQMIAFEDWPDVFNWSVVITLAVLVGVVNSRLILMAAGLRPWLGRLPAWQAYPSLYYLSDPGYILAMHYRRRGGNDAAVYLGTAMLFLLCWTTATSAGHVFGASIADPHRYGLDLIMPIFFAVMLTPLWSGPRHAVSWVVAGGVALIAQWLLPGFWYIILGAIFGSLTGGFLDDDVPEEAI